MRYMIYTMFFIIFIAEYLFEKFGVQSKIFAALPEMVSIYTGVYVLLVFSINRRAKIRMRYMFFSGFFLLHIAIGIIGNHVQPLAVLAGLRTYLKFIPFFLLPLVYDQDVPRIRSQLIVLLALGIMQLPLALYQKLFEFSYTYSGDYIAGTLRAAPKLTLYLIGTIAVLVGFYLKKRITGKTFALLTAFAFIPTAINETKATIILLPLALLIPTLFEVDKQNRLKILATVIPIGVLLILGFNYAYQMLYTETGRSDAFTFFSSARVEKYLYKGAEAGEVSGESEGEVGRIDAVILAYKENSKDFFRLVWGVGIGNAAVSFSRKFQGKYNAEYMRLGGKMGSIAGFLWEIGLLGIVHVIWLLLLIFSDAIKLRKRDDLVGALALGWIGVTTIFLVSMPYQNLITTNGLIYPFSYISGYLAAMAYDKQKSIQGNELRGASPAA